jgi:hypothetical protein
LGLLIALIAPFLLFAATGPSRLFSKTVATFILLPTAFVWVLDVVVPLLMRILLWLLSLADSAEGKLLRWADREDRQPEPLTISTSPLPTLTDRKTLLQYIIDERKDALLILYLAFALSLSIAATQMLSTLSSALNHGYFVVEYATSDTSTWRMGVIIMTLKHLGIMMAIPLVAMVVAFAYSLASPFHESERILRENSTRVALILGSILVATTAFVMPAARDLVEYLCQ